MAIRIPLVAAFAASALIDILAPIVLAVFLARRFHARWRWWWYGVLVFLLFQGITRIPAMIWFQSRPAVAEALKDPVYFWPWLLFAAFTAGLFEEGGRWLAFRHAVPPRDRTWRTALMLGAGHGGLESIGVGLLTFAGLAAYLALALVPLENLGAPASQVEEGRRQFERMASWEPLLGAWERLGALAIQVALTVLVVQAFHRGRRWWWYALAAHTLVDFTSVGVLVATAKLWGPQTAKLLTEALVALYALLSLWLILKLRPRPDKPDPVPLADPTLPIP